MRAGFWGDCAIGDIEARHGKDADQLDLTEDRYRTLLVEAS